MSSPFVGQLALFGFNFAPKGWAMCQGQLLSISQNTALFSLLGTFYGGDGKSNFALPDLQGAVPVHQGQGNGLSQYFIGESDGTQTVTLLISEMPAHPHSIKANAAPIPPPVGQVANNAPGQPAAATKLYVTGNGNVTLDPNTLTLVGGSQPHNNMMPTLTMNWCIAMQGVYPARS
jgi:microcystin-dependent protein